MSKLTDGIRDFLFAPKCTCVNCQSLLGVDRGPFCNACYNMLDPLYLTDRGRTFRCMNCGEVTDRKRCLRCKKSTAGGMYAYSAYEYKEPVKRMIQEFKYKNAYSLSKWMAEEQAKSVMKYGAEFDFIVPVPIHLLRKVERGYNQSGKLAKELSGIIRIPCINALKRIRHTSKQAGADKEERIKRLKGAFKAVMNLEGKRILLVDDVVTTGSTMIECVHALMDAGASHVELSTFAITMPDRDKKQK